MNKHVRILVGVVEVSGHYRCLYSGLRALGYTCDYVTYRQHPYAYPLKVRKPTLIRMAHWFYELEGRYRGSRLILVVANVGALLTQATWGLGAAFRYDVYIFAFGRSLLPMNVDLPLLRFLKKRVICNIGHGSDARPPYINGAAQSPDGAVRPSIRKIYRRTKRIARRVNWIEKYATIVIGSPSATTPFARQKLINIFALGLPMCGLNGRNKNESPADTKEEERIGVTTIAHAPSHPAAKGTTRIINAIDALRERGHDIKFKLLSGVTHDVVVKELRTCDFVVDQAFSPSPMAGFAAEAAWFGKPAVVGGYGLNKVKQYFPAGMFPPSRLCHPDELETAIEEMIIDRQKRVELGKEAQRFVREKWSTSEVARRYARLVEGEIPEEWWLDPKDVVYVESVFQQEEEAKNVVRKLVSRYGSGALCLSHRKDLEAAFMQFANISGRS